jgi:methyl-accepting chemotaxis protein
MTRNWTFGQKLGAGFGLTVLLSLVIAVIAVSALRSVVEAKDKVIRVDAQTVIDARDLATMAARKIVALRGYLLVRQDDHLKEMHTARSEFVAAVKRLRERVSDAESRRLLADVERAEAAHDAAALRSVELRRQGADMPQVIQLFDEQVHPARETLAKAIDALTARSSYVLEQERQEASAIAAAAVNSTLLVALLVVLSAIATAIFLARTLSNQIGNAVAQVQSSSAELQSAANQQATATKEQATAMSEITTTITELLATSRQIAESSRRVAQIAEQTAGSARSGDTTVDRAHESIAGIRRQVDVIVSQMLELGKKSQQIGAVLDIVSELAEQTNILAINATIEAAGAGDAGKRFAVVADEIRKLADRVGGSTKEIRGLIDDVRSSVNTTVMTTETGSKAVDAGSRQFAEVAASFKQIAGLVSTTTEAAREIELSTKQQTTAVEQVNVAITNVAQATTETEASSGQTFQTASQLSKLSRELLRLVQPQAAATTR